MARTLLRSLTVLSVAVAASAGLAGCTTPSSPTTSPAASVSATETTAPTTPTSTPTVTSTPTPTPTPTPTSTAIAGTPVGVNCDQLVTAQQMYTFNANYTLSDSYTPKAGSRAATVVGLKGIACEWINDSSNEKIDIAVANLGQQGMLAQQDKLKSNGKEVEVGGTSGYFAAGSVGRTDAFAVKYWIGADSTAFETADDASDLVADVIGNLPN